MKTQIGTLLSLGAATISLQAQTEIFTSYHNESLDGIYNCGRVLINATFDDTFLGQWEDSGNAGIVGDGRVWHAFSRYKMFQRDLFNALDSAGSITWTTGLYAKEKNREIDPINGGHDVDVYLVLDPDGNVIPSGQEPDIFTAWDWANEFGWGYDNTVYVGRIPQSEAMATEEEKNENGTLDVDSPAMRITFDVTAALKQWIADGLLTANSTIAFGFVQRGAVISDGSGNPDFSDPNLYTHSQMVFEIQNAHLTTGPAVGPEMGPPPFDDYELVDGYVDTGSWMGWVYVEQVPWAYNINLSKYIYVNDKSGWVYIPK